MIFTEMAPPKIKHLFIITIFQEYSFKMDSIFRGRMHQIILMSSSWMLHPKSFIYNQGSVSFIFVTCKTRPLLLPLQLSWYVLAVLSDSCNLKEPTVVELLGQNDRKEKVRKIINQVWKITSFILTDKSSCTENQLLHCHNLYFAYTQHTCTHKYVHTHIHFCGGVIAIGTESGIAKLNSNSSWFHFVNFMLMLLEQTWIYLPLPQG